MAGAELAATARGRSTGGRRPPHVRRTQGDSPRRPPAPRRLRSFLSNALPGPAPRRRPCGLHSRRFGCPTASRWPCSPCRSGGPSRGPRMGPGAGLVHGGQEGGRARELRVAPGKPSPSPPGVPGALSFSPGRQKGQLKGTAVGLPQATSDFARVRVGTCFCVPSVSLPGQLRVYVNPVVTNGRTPRSREGKRHGMRTGS